MATRATDTDPAARPAATMPMSSARPLALARWLWTVAAMVLVMVVVGGITRLTESGLSITQWQPIAGALPPLTQAQWENAFALYRQIPEYRNVTGPAGMDLAAFKFIYFWEWFHRLWGRLIGLAFALPLAWFWFRRAIPAGYLPRLLALLALGGLQGAFGWFMVRSGLSGEMTDVSHFWLSVHLLTAFFTLAGLTWTARDLMRLHTHPAAGNARLTQLGLVVAAILFVQLLLGAWVAGLNAGHASYSWPLMQGRLMPEYDTTRGIGWAMTHDPFLLHFLHRWWAFVAAAALLVLANRVHTPDRRAARAIGSVMLLQIALGIATVTSEVALWIAVAHQGVGAILVCATAWAMHTLGRHA